VASAEETLRALADVVVPGPPDDPTPGAAGVEAERFISHYLDVAMPGLAGQVPALLDELASVRRPGVAFAALRRVDREAVLEGLADHPVPEMRELATLLVALSIASVYGEWSGQDADGAIVRRPLGWELTGWPGPRDAVRSLLHDA
jgi:hypothetical protein